MDPNDRVIMESKCITFFLEFCFPSFFVKLSWTLMNAEIQVPILNRSTKDMLQSMVNTQFHKTLFCFYEWVSFLQSISWWVVVHKYLRYLPFVIACWYDWVLFFTYTDRGDNVVMFRGRVLFHKRVAVVCQFP